MSSDNATTIALIDSPKKINNPPITCTVTHTVSIQTTPIMTSIDLIKLIFFLGLTLMSIVGSIVACSTSHSISPYVPQAPQGPVDGQWSDWNDWSQCSIFCSSTTVPLGNMTRVRYCNSPPPQQDGKVCEGPSVERSECFKKPCPIPVDGNWAEWSSWSSCSGTCQSNGSIPMQIRTSSCTNPSPRDGGKLCEGQSVQERFCSWLVHCPVDGQWSEWHIAGACESVNRKSCSLGKKLFQRQCNNPSPISSGKNCEGLKEKNEDCWFDIGCPIDLQPPLALHVFGNGSGLFEIQWTSVPYGVTAVKYRIYLTVEDNNKSQIETIHMNISAIPPTDVSGRKYSTTADMRRFLKSGNFAALVVRLSSFDYWDKESFLSSPVQSKSADVDGQWGDWDHWSECSTQCINKRGSRFRKRKCDNPPPTTDGKPCQGKSEEEASCIGMETDC